MVFSLVEARLECGIASAGGCWVANHLEFFFLLEVVYSELNVPAPHYVALEFEQGIVILNLI
jgi:hypothetical protein